MFSNTKFFEILRSCVCFDRRPVSRGYQQSFPSVQSCMEIKLICNIFVFSYFRPKYFPICCCLYLQVCLCGAGVFSFRLGFAIALLGFAAVVLICVCSRICLSLFLDLFCVLICSYIQFFVICSRDFGYLCVFATSPCYNNTF